MFLPNTNADHNSPLDPADATMLSIEAAIEVERFLAHRSNHEVTPLHSLAGLAGELNVGAIYVKDEGYRLGLGSFKALGGAYAVTRLVLEEASQRLGRTVDIGELHTDEVKAVAAGMTFCCATDGNHGRSVAQGAQMVGATSVIFVHGGVSDDRIAAIAHYGAQMIRFEGSYDESVVEAARVSGEKGWTVVSDTSWPGYERIPGLVMQGYTALLREAYRQFPEVPTHVFIQSGVGGFAAALAGHLAIELGDKRPIFVVVDPARAACLFETARAGHIVQVELGAPTVMSMLECYEPSMIAWRILSRVADGFITVGEESAIEVMKCLAHPVGDDPAIVAGESGGTGLAGLMKAVRIDEIREQLGLDQDSRIFVVNTEGATDPDRYTRMVGIKPKDVRSEHERS